MEDATAGDAAEQAAEGTRDGESAHDKKLVAIIVQPSPLCFCNCRSLISHKLVSNYNRFIILLLLLHHKSVFMYKNYQLLLLISGDVCCGGK
jgi:hypothetical protein